MNKSVLPKDIKMPAATLAYPQYIYHQLRWQDSIPVPLELNQELYALHIVFLAIYRLERHNQYNGNTFLYQNC